MMVAMLNRDPHFQITSGTYVDELPRHVNRRQQRAASSAKFVRYVNAVAASNILQPRKNMSSRTRLRRKKPVTGR